jgi:hypothetical protein
MDWSKSPGFGDKQFHLVEGARPVFAKEAGETAVGEEFAGGLASRAIVGFVAGVADALDFCAAARAGLFITAVHGHPFAEGGDFFGEFAGGLRAEAIGPAREAGADGFEEALDLGDRELLSERERREFGFPKDFVGIGVSDTAEEVRVGQSPLESVIGGEKYGGELLGCGAEDFKAARIKRAEAVFAEDEVERGAFLGAGFGPEKGTVGEIEGGKTARRGNFDAAGLRAERMPVKAAGDHEMEDQPEAVFEADADTFAEAAELEDFFAGGVGERRVCCAQEKGTDDADGFESLAKDARFEGLDVNSDVWELRHTLSRPKNRIGLRRTWYNDLRFILANATPRPRQLVDGTTTACGISGKTREDCPKGQRKVFVGMPRKNLHIQK